MKGYRKGLNNFIEYILTRYSKDKEVQNFRTIYETHKVELESKKKRRMESEPTIRISHKTAKLCKDLVIAELTKQSIMACYSIEYLEQLHNANTELISGYVEKIYSKVLLERLKNEG